MNLFNDKVNKRLVALWRGGKATFPSPFGGARDPVWCSELNGYLIGCSAPPFPPMPVVLTDFNVYVYLEYLDTVDMCLWALDVRDVKIKQCVFVVADTLRFPLGELQILKKKKTQRGKK